MDNSILITLVCLSVAVIALAAVLAWLIFRRTNKVDGETGRKRRARRMAEAKTKDTLKPCNPLRGVTFSDLLSADAASEKVSRNVVAWLEESLGKGGMTALEMAASKNMALGPRGGLSDEMLQIIADGRLTKVPGPLSQTLTAGRLVQTATTIAPSLLVQASAALPVVVGCVQLVMGFDKLGPVKTMDAKIDKLLELRAIDKLSSLQAIFEEMKGELCSDDYDEAHLKHMRLKLKELRFSLLNETRLKLSQMRPPLPKQFMWVKWGLKNRRQLLKEQLISEVSHLREIRVAIQLEQIIWMAIGQSPHFIDEIAPDIVVELKAIGELAKERIGWVNEEDLEEIDTIPFQMAEGLEARTFATAKIKRSRAA